jgi:hypothetical protein
VENPDKTPGHAENRIFHGRRPFSRVRFSTAGIRAI